MTRPPVIRRLLRQIGLTVLAAAAQFAAHVQVHAAEEARKKRRNNLLTYSHWRSIPVRATQSTMAPGCNGPMSSMTTQPPVTTGLAHPHAE